MKLQQTITAFAFSICAENALLPFHTDFDTGVEPNRHVEIEK